eukprot:TRINITY_DN1464_c0_g1_i1.p1 TRINITY_DN1464_c0_g1~~TRINITY_DN1464_c0_g1_i1.p1  ORF type:complete len:105 (-),score=7.67 TRINITY_DN1464_c0_g1_i1:587-901(-)
MFGDTYLIKDETPESPIPGTYYNALKYISNEPVIRNIPWSVNMSVEFYFHANMSDFYFQLSNPLVERNLANHTLRCTTNEACYEKCNEMHGRWNNNSCEVYQVL